MLLPTDSYPLRRGLRPSRAGTSQQKNQQQWKRRRHRHPHFAAAEQATQTAPEIEMSNVVEQGVGNRSYQQREQQAERLSADDDDRHRTPRTGPSAATQGKRNHARHQRGRGHQNRTQTVVATLHNSVQPVCASRPQFLDVIDLQNRILLHDSEENQNSQRCIDH